MVFSSALGDQPLNIRAVGEQELRDLFNGHRMAERAATGEFTVEVKSSRHPSSTAAHEPVCTHSQILRYRARDGEQIAVVHQYLRTDGSLGASGKPDPKWLRLGRDVYVLA